MSPGDTFLQKVNFQANSDLINVHHFKDVNIDSEKRQLFLN